MSTSLSFEYRHPTKDANGKYLSHANVIWSQRDSGNMYYPVSRYAMRNGAFPCFHPCAPYSKFESVAGGQIGSSPALDAFRARGYWASCFPEGDGITLKWWDVEVVTDKTRDQVVKDIRECFGWDVK